MMDHMVMLRQEPASGYRRSNNTKRLDDMSAQSSKSGFALVPTMNRALTRATDRLLSIAASAKDDAERERFPTLLRRHPHFAITGLCSHYLLDTDLIERFTDRWDWWKLSHSHALPWSLGLIERFADR